MKNRDRNREHNPVGGIGAFLIAFGLLLGAVMMDVLNLGAPGEYVKWEILLIFLGVVSLFRAKLGEAVVLVAVGTYFLLPDLDFLIPEFVNDFYWPAAIILAGFGFIIAGIIRNSRKKYDV